MGALRKKSDVVDYLKNKIRKIENEKDSDGHLLRDASLAAAGLGAGGVGLYLGDKWQPNNTIVVGAGHIKDHGVPKDSLIRDDEKTGIKILDKIRKKFWRKTPAGRMYIADSGAGHIVPGEAIVEALLEHPDVGYTSDKKWLLDTAFRGGRYGSHKNPYHSTNNIERAFGTIDSGFGPLSTGLPGPLALNEPEFKTNPFGRLMVETDPIVGTPNISAIHGVQGMTSPETWKDTNIASFGSKREKSYYKIDPNIDLMGEEKPTPVTRGIKNILRKTWGKYKPVIHASDTISPYMSNATYQSAQDIIDAVRSGSLSEQSVLRELAKQHPEYSELIEDAIAKNKRIAFITGSSRGDVVAQKTQDLLDHLKKNNINDVQIISAMGERLTPTMSQLAKSNAISPELREIISKELAVNPNLNLEQLKQMLPKGGAHYKAIDRIADIPRTDKLITDPSVIKLPGVYSTIKANGKDVKTFLALQTMFPHWASTGMNSANEIMMLPGTQAMPVNIKDLKLREIDNALKKGVINKAQAREMKNIFLERWNAGTMDLYAKNLGRTASGLYATNSPEDFVRAMDDHYSRGNLQKNESVRRAQRMLNESKAARKRFADQYIEWLDKQHGKAKRWSSNARLMGLGGLAVGGAFGVKALIEAIKRLKEHTPRKRKNIQKESMLKQANRWSRELAELDSQNTPEAKEKMLRIKSRLYRGLPTDVSKLDTITLRAIRHILKNTKNPRVLKDIATKQTNEHIILRRAIEREMAEGQTFEGALKILKAEPERAGWWSATRLVEHEPGPTDSKFSRRGFEGDALWGYDPLHGDVVIKKTHLHPEVTKFRKSGPIKLKPSLTKKTISPYAGQLDEKALSSGSRIQEKIDLMREYPSIMANVIRPTQTGYVMPRLNAAEDLPPEKLKPLLKDFVDRLWRDMHPYDKLFTNKKEITHQILEGNPKEKWDGTYRRIFGNRTPITLRNGTAIEDYHLGNLMLNDRGKMVISDPQLSHRGSRWNRHMAGVGLAGLGAAGLGLGVSGLRHLLHRKKIEPDATDLTLGGVGVASLFAAKKMRDHAWNTKRLTPMRGAYAAPLFALGGASLGALGLRNLLGKKKKQNYENASEQSGQEI